MRFQNYFNPECLQDLSNSSGMPEMATKNFGFPQVLDPPQMSLRPNLILGPPTQACVLGFLKETDLHADIHLKLPFS